MIESEDFRFLQDISDHSVTNSSTVTAANALDTLTFAQGGTSGTTQITAATTGTSFMYKVYDSGTAPKKLPSGVTAAAAGVTLGQVSHQKPVVILR
ncbi:MAG: hypothetical protein AB7C97_11350 [Oscillospiraceae bacterium]